MYSGKSAHEDQNDVDMADARNTVLIDFLGPAGARSRSIIDNNTNDANGSSIAKSIGPSGLCGAPGKFRPQLEHSGERATQSAARYSEI